MFTIRKKLPESRRRKDKLAYIQSKNFRRSVISCTWAIITQIFFVPSSVHLSGFSSKAPISSHIFPIISSVWVFTYFRISLSHNSSGLAASLFASLAEDIEYNAEKSKNGRKGRGLKELDKQSVTLDLAKAEHPSCDRSTDVGTHNYVDRLC